MGRRRRQSRSNWRRKRRCRRRSWRRWRRKRRSISAIGGVSCAPDYCTKCPLSKGRTAIPMCRAHSLKSFALHYIELFDIYYIILHYFTSHHNDSQKSLSLHPAHCTLYTVQCTHHAYQTVWFVYNTEFFEPVGALHCNPLFCTIFPPFALCTVHRTSGIIAHETRAEDLIVIFCWAVHAFHLIHHCFKHVATATWIWMRILR